MISLILLTASSLHWAIEQILAFGIVVWIWNHLGLSPKATLIGNIIAIIVLIVVAFIL